MNEQDMKNALQAEAGRQERYKLVVVASTVAGMVASIPFWKWNGWVALLVIALVGGGLSSLSKDSPFRK